MHNYSYRFLEQRIEATGEKRLLEHSTLVKHVYFSKDAFSLVVTLKCSDF